VKQGVSEEHAKMWSRSPKEAIAYWKAAQFDKMQAAARQPPKPPVTPATPVKAVSGRSATPAKSIYDDSLSDAEWVKLRNAQQAKRRA
jgi:hypothetical protein